MKRRWCPVVGFWRFPCESNNSIFIFIVGTSGFYFSGDTLLFTSVLLRNPYFSAMYWWEEEMIKNNNKNIYMDTNTKTGLLQLYRSGRGWWYDTGLACISQGMWVLPNFHRMCVYSIHTFWYIDMLDVCLINVRILLCKRSKCDCRLGKVLWFNCVYWEFSYITTYLKRYM